MILFNPKPTGHFQCSYLTFRAHNWLKNDLLLPHLLTLDIMSSVTFMSKQQKLQLNSVQKAGAFLEKFKENLEEIQMRVPDETIQKLQQEMERVEY